MKNKTRIALIILGGYEEERQELLAYIGAIIGKNRKDAAAEYTKGMAG